ncbi:MAG: hypothetical protein K2J98_01655, partial [Malacoplasma sp.]|nr:hypothetical protein [Malacoplasma sp.]
MKRKNLVNFDSVKEILNLVKANKGIFLDFIKYNNLLILSSDDFVNNSFIGLLKVFQTPIKTKKKNAMYINKAPPNNPKIEKLCGII